MSAVTWPERALEELWIGGEWRRPNSAGRFDIVCPSTEDVYQSVVTADEADVEVAVSAARTSFDDRRWRGLTQDERSAVLDRARRILASCVDEIAHVITSELGTTLPRSAEGVRDRALNYIADGVDRVSRLLEPRTIVDPKGTSLVVREPIGVVGAIAPWNGPFSIGAGKIVPALLTGCSVVFKPAPQTSLDIHYLAAALHEAGLPPGVLNIVPGDAEVGQAIVASPGVDAITFTGSTAVGREIGAVAGRLLKPVSLELGGKSAAVVLDDAEITKTAQRLAASFCAGTGQSCIALSRIFVPTRLHDELLDAIVAEIEAMRIGDPFLPTTELGPLVTKSARERVERYVSIGRDEGAFLAAGGRRPAGLDRGWYYEPTLFARASNDMRIAREEIFGPVGCLIEYTDVEKAIAMANDNDYGLHGAVFTRDEDRAMNVAQAIHTGTFGINGFGFTVAAPFGGYKQSGVGREHGDDGLLFTLQTKSIKLEEGRRR